MATVKDLLSREAIRNVDRLMFLSDGVYAIALTILVLDIKLPASFGTFHISPSMLLNALILLCKTLLVFLLVHLARDQYGRI